MSRGTVFSIKRFALHDGSGLRTTLFFKGCPLRCPWCQNPEGLSREISLVYYQNRCLSCGTCISACPQQAISCVQQRDKRFVRLDHDACKLCGICTDVCPSNALIFNGWEISCEDVVEELLKDRIFYETTGGGITLSGGEPLMQSDFACCIARKCHVEGIKTNIETSLFADRSTLEELLPYIDTWYTDLKIADPAEHQDVIGVGNDRIIKNLRFLVSEGADIIIRIPLIPKYTDREENIIALADIIVSLVPQPPVELLNFNPLPEQKYRLLEMRWPFPEGTGRLSPQRVKEIAFVLEQHDVRSIIT